MSEDCFDQKVNIAESGGIKRSEGLSTYHTASADRCHFDAAPQPVAHDSPSAGHDTQQGGDQGLMEGSISMGAATYAVFRHFAAADRAITKQELLRSLLVQKMEQQDCVDHKDSDGV